MSNEPSMDLPAGPSGPKRVTYWINCDCASYRWTRKPAPAGRFMRCRGCGRRLGDMQVSVAKTQAPVVP